MKKLLIPILSIMMLINSIPSYGWGAKGHDIVAAIAEQKAGIIKPGAPCVLYADNESDVVEVIRQRCAETGSALVIPDTDALKLGEARPGCLHFSYRNCAYTLRLSGIYQVRNALTAIEALHLLPSLGYTMTEDAIERGLAAAQFPARFEVLSQNPPILLDGAHNRSGMDALAENIDFYYPDQPILYLCGMLRDKNPEDALAPILRADTTRFCACITPPSPRSMKAEDLCEIFRTRGIASAPYASIDAALDALKELRGDAESDLLPILCFGSLYSAGDIRRACGIYNETAE